jgi:excisionase family DNA binding protein
LTLSEAAELLRVSPDELEQLAQGGEVPARRVGTAWRFNCAAVMEWLIGNGEPTSPLTSEEMRITRGAGAPTSETEASTSPGEPDAADEDEAIGEAPEGDTAEDVFLRTQRVLLGPGDAALDFGQFYSETDLHTLAALSAGAVLATLEQEALITSFQARVGVGRETELFAGTAYVDQDNTVFFGSESIATTSRSDLSNVVLGVRHTLMREGPGRPNLIGTLGADIPTGDASRAVRAGLALVKSVDPVALFASINYLHVDTEAFEDISLLEVEDRVDLTLGYALALNDTLALSMALSGAFTSATSFPNAELRRQDGYSLRFGLTSWLARRIYIEPSVSFNLSGPADGFAFGIAVPYTLTR